MKRYLAFKSNGFLIAVETSSVIEVCLLPHLEAVPSRLQSLEGTLNYRNSLVPVFSLGGLFGLTPVAPHPYQKLILLKSARRVFGLRVEELLDQIEIEDEQLRPASELSAGLPHLESLAQTSDGVVIIKHAGRFLAEAEETELQRLQSETGVDFAEAAT